MINDEQWHSSKWRFELKQPSIQMNSFDCGMIVAMWVVMEAAGIRLRRLDVSRCTDVLRYKLMYAMLRRVRSGGNPRAEGYDMEAAGFVDASQAVLVD